MRKNQNPILETFISIKFDAECNETGHAIVFDRFHEDVYIATTIIPNMIIKMIHAGSDTFTEWLSSNKILVHISIIVMLKQRWACGLFIITDLKNNEVVRSTLLQGASFRNQRVLQQQW